MWYAVPQYVVILFHVGKMKWELSPLSSKFFFHTWTVLYHPSFHLVKQMLHRLERWRHGNYCSSRTFVQCGKPKNDWYLRSVRSSYTQYGQYTWVKYPFMPFILSVFTNCRKILLGKKRIQSKIQIIPSTMKHSMSQSVDNHELFSAFSKENTLSLKSGLRGTSCLCIIFVIVSFTNHFSSAGFYGATYWLGLHQLN